ncbi:zinc metalloproteinase nas-4-like [Portunus trituberculatus]|uniref:zinc metalloproteinase nas-4-like n=1 Tax=Portunus trituberculatus TaxID=210409 RepID=UPI001E1CF40E|nr:zinc metalloproteinase nas-4-like [Portunus trituberculatus]
MKGVASFVLLAALASPALAAPDRRFPKTGKEWTPQSLVNPDELGDYFEGDIVLPLPPMCRNGLIDEKYRWPGGRVAYKFDTTYSEDDKDKVRKAMNEYETQTGGCISFHERTSEDDYILFKHDENDGCHSSVGKRGGRQTINYPDWCLNRFGSTLHEMYHALGFHHEQSRYDRDDYVTIMWDNIEPGHEHNFNKYSSSVISGFGEDYDYGSVMHYSAHAFSVNGEKTIVTKDPNAHIGQRDGLSPVDWAKLKNMYKC